MTRSVPAPRETREAVSREFAGVLQQWIRTLELDARRLHLRGNHLFAADIHRMAREAKHVLEVLQ